MMKKILYGLLVLLLVIGGLAAWLFNEYRKTKSEDPTVWEQDIQALLKNEAQRTLPENALLFVGSSSIRLFSSLEEIMRPFPVVQNGFGGAKIPDVRFYRHRLIDAYKPSNVVLFIGMNDIRFDRHKNLDEIWRELELLLQEIKTALPDASTYVIALRPSPSGVEHTSEVEAFNKLAKTYANTVSGVFFIDPNAAMKDSNGNWRTDLYLWDKTHLNSEGYQLWGGAIKQELIKLIAESN